LPDDRSLGTNAGGATERKWYDMYLMSMREGELRG
jgi:hypothetical protein